MSAAVTMGPHARMDNYAMAKGWQPIEPLEAQRPMTRRQYQRWWSKYNRWLKLPADVRHGG